MQARNIPATTPRFARWAQLVAGVSVVHPPALERLDIPAMVLDLDQYLVRAANQAAADVFNVPLGEIPGRNIADVVDINDRDSYESLRTGLRDGVIDGHRAVRRITARGGVVKELFVSSRVVTVCGARSVVNIFSPLNDAASIPSLPLLALDPLAVGLVGRDGLIEQLSTDVRYILGGAPEEWIGRPFLELLHPQDVGDLAHALGGSTIGDLVVRHLRMRSRQGPWVALELLAVPLTDDLAPELAIAILSDNEEPAEVPNDRTAELEMRLNRIAAELRAAGVIDRVDDLPAANDNPRIQALTARQQQILTRLLGGDRVPTIARDLFLSPSTVRNHLTAIFGRFGVHSQAELLALLRRRPKP